MSLSLSKTLTLILPRHFSPLFPLPSLFLPSQSTHSSSRDNDLTDLSDSASSPSDPLLRNLEDAIHRIVVRRSAPDWLPFLPGASYWVPMPPSQLCGIAHLVDKFANPLTQDQSLSTTTIRGWPSSQYFIQGGPLHPVEVETTSPESDASQHDEHEEG